MLDLLLDRGAETGPAVSTNFFEAMNMTLPGGIRPLSSLRIVYLVRLAS